MQRLIVISDLDGTLLDGDYSLAAAAPALQMLRAHKIPLILCSSKTRPEIEYYREQLGNQHPFISENGGGVFIPEGYFPPRVFRHGPLAEELGGYWLFRLGAPYALLRHALGELRREGFELTGFGDMSVTEISALTRLPLAQAALAKERDFDEPFLFRGTPREQTRLEESIRRHRLHLTRGRLWHLLGDSDKGRAVALLLTCYRASGDDLLAIGLGDQRNDFPLLEQVDIPILIRQPEGDYAPGFTAPGLLHSDRVGPAGWNEMLLSLLPTLLENVPK
jgi:mannosyl-3-phosphoglycerate phosphatase